MCYNLNYYDKKAMSEVILKIQNAIKEIQICLNAKGGRACGKSYAYGKLDAYKEVLKIIEALKEQSNNDSNN